MGQLQSIHGELKKLGYEIYALSPDRPAKVRESAAKDSGYEYTLLSDPKQQAALTFGVGYRVGDRMLGALKGYGIDIEEASGESHRVLPVPAVFVIGDDGKIAFQYVNPDFKVRIDPDTLLAAARAAK